MTIKAFPDGKDIAAVLGYDQTHKAYRAALPVWYKTYRTSPAATD